MAQRVLVFLLPVVMLAALCAPCCAQIAPYPAPDAAVRGWGAIPVRTGAVGVFDINVSRTGANLYGGFKFAENTTDGTRGHVIVGTRILGLTAEGNTATIRAEGYWNSMLAVITVEVLDDNFSGDWFHITAVPKGPLTIIYDAAGGVMKGDVSVYVKPAQDYYAKGYGLIAYSMNTRMAKFQFNAWHRGNVVGGEAYYAEYASFTTSAQRVPISIYLPKVTYFNVDGFTAYLGGPGRINGRPAQISIRAIDYSKSMIPVLRPDEFYIRATLAYDTAATSIIYPEMGGPLKSGNIDIVVP